MIRELIDIQYTRNGMNSKRGISQVRGDVLEMSPAYSGGEVLQVESFGGEVDRITEIDTLAGEIRVQLGHTVTSPVSHYVVPREKTEQAVRNILEEMKEQTAFFGSEDKLLET